MISLNRRSLNWHLPPKRLWRIMNTKQNYSKCYNKWISKLKFLDILLSLDLFFRFLDFVKWSCSLWMCGGLEGQLRPGIFRCSCFYKVIWSKVPSFESYFDSFTKVARVGCWCLEKVMTMDWFADVTLNFLWYQAKFF